MVTIKDCFRNKQNKNSFTWDIQPLKTIRAGEINSQNLFFFLLYSNVISFFFCIGSQSNSYTFQHNFVLQTKSIIQLTVGIVLLNYLLQFMLPKYDIYLFKQEKDLTISGRFWWRGETVLGQFPKRDLTYPAGMTLMTTRRVNPAQPRLHLSMGMLFIKDLFKFK